jgi:hypothetical protein
VEKVKKKKERKGKEREKASLNPSPVTELTEISRHQSETPKKKKRDQNKTQKNVSAERKSTVHDYS